MKVTLTPHVSYSDDGVVYIYLGIVAEGEPGSPITELGSSDASLATIESDTVRVSDFHFNGRHHFDAKNYDIAGWQNTEPVRQELAHSSNWQNGRLELMVFLDEV